MGENTHWRIGTSEHVVGEVGGDLARAAGIAWSRNGRELFCIDAGRRLAVDARAAGRRAAPLPD